MSENIETDAAGFQTLPLVAQAPEFERCQRWLAECLPRLRRIAKKGPEEERGARTVEGALLATHLALELRRRSQASAPLRSGTELTSPEAPDERPPAPQDLHPLEDLDAPEDLE